MPHFKNKFYLLFMFTIIQSAVNAQSSAFEIQGHRGARGLVPENTIPAFLRAIDEGVNTLEMDVVITKDGKVVVSHEPYFNFLITTKPNGELVTKDNQGNIYEMNYRTVRKYDVGKRGNALFPEQQPQPAFKPLLSKVIRTAEKYAKQQGRPPLKYNIEIKSLVEEYGKSQPNVEEFSDLVKKVIFKKLPPERVSIQSFDFNVLIHWNKEISKGNYPKCSLSALIEPDDNNDIKYNLDKLGFKPDIWSPYFKKLTQEMVAELHKQNIKVIPWTVNEPKDMKLVKEIGCDGLITDYPNRIEK